MAKEYCYKCEGFIPRGFYSKCKFSNKNNIDGSYNFCRALRGACISCNINKYKEETNLVKSIINNIFK